MSSEITIKEQTGQKRTVTLRGAGLPKMGANWPGKQRVVTTWYPGNSAQGSQQVLGPIDPPSAWNGEWNTTRLVTSHCLFDGTAVLLADDLRLVLEDMFRRGALMLVVWKADPERDILGGAREITREGRCTDWNFAYDRIDDIVWTMTWEWIGRGSSQQRAIEVDQQSTTNAIVRLQIATALIDASVNLTTLNTANRGIPKLPHAFSLGQLEALADAPNQLMKQISQAANSITNRLTRIANLADKFRRIPFEVANQAIDVAHTAVASANNFVDKMSRISPEQMQTQQKLAALTRAATYFHGATRQAQYMSREGDKAAQAATQAAAASGAPMKPLVATVINGSGGVTMGKSPPSKNPGQNTQPLQVYLTKQGDTLLGISAHFYGTPAYAIGIAKANGLPISTISPKPGTTLLIPPVSALEALLTTPPKSLFGVGAGLQLAPAGGPVQPGGVITPPGNL